MRSLLLAGLFGFLMPFSSAYASAVRGCEIDAKVLAVKSDKGEVTLSLEVVDARPTGHSAGEAICDKAGTKLEFPVDNDAEVIAAKVTVGDTVRVEDVMIYNMDAKGARSFHRQGYISTLPSKAITTEPSAKATKVTGCVIKAKVTSAKTETKDDKKEVTLALQVIKSTKLKGTTQRCPKKRDTLTFAPDNDKLVIDSQVNEDDTIEVKDVIATSPTDATIKELRKEFVRLISKEKGDGVVPK